MAEAVGRMARGEGAGRLAGFIPLFSADQFLWDYLDDAKLLVRLNQVMRRATLPALPASFARLLPAFRHAVAERQAELLAGPAASSGANGHEIRSAFATLDGQARRWVVAGLAKVKQLGYDGVEVPLGEWDLADCQKWAGRFQELGLQPIGVAARTPADNPIHSDPKIRALGVTNNRRATRFLPDHRGQIADRPLPFGLESRLRLFPRPHRRRMARGVDSMRQTAEHAAKLGIMLVPEYVNRFECYLVNTAADMVRFVHQVDHPNCRMLYDTFHANIEEQDLRRAILSCQAETIHVHISENDRGTPGTGHVDWTTTFDR